MIPVAAWKREYDLEINHAISARENGNEGMARVCARRAAGIIIGEYLARRGFTHLSHSAYDRISLLNSVPGIDSRVKVIINHFLLKVNRNHEFPAEIDLLSEVKILAEILLVENNN